MKSITALLFTLAAASTYASRVNFEYYSDSNCANTKVGLANIGAGTDVGSCGKCVDLSFPGKSFHIGSPASEAQVPEDCEIIGYAKANCKGAINLRVEGPSKGKKCYKSGDFQGPSVGIGYARSETAFVAVLVGGIALREH
ncbi:uncharacterized protein LTR77_006682 [Saxophila tyrrhenica]|uniref:Uncharacterized protein n=1 Tax=Saxophila tyrrhenica TaxID=1690608 RepID=A0AAV9P682_9PEZI|nr:hypothetical protein LTR77_006682 [Saxophila tyrrhenica]